MAIPAGAIQRAVLVAVPLALVVLIFATPTLFGRRQPQPTDIPLLLAEVTGQAWNGSVNETGLLYVRGALGVPLYEYIAVNVTGLGGFPNFAADCGGILAGGGSNWSCSEAFVPSLFVKIPAGDGQAVNVTAVAVREGAVFRYNVTVEFVWDEAAWTLRVQPEDAATPQDYEVFSVAMRLEAEP